MTRRTDHRPVLPPDLLAIAEQALVQDDLTLYREVCRQLLVYCPVELSGPCPGCDVLCVGCGGAG